MREDVAALLARPGWTKVSRAQRKVLNEIAERHDVLGYAFAAEAIRRARPDEDPLQAAMAADRMWQDAQRRRAEAEEQAWQQAKADERRDVTRLGADPEWMAEPVKR